MFGCLMEESLGRESGKGGGGACVGVQRVWVGCKCVIDVSQNQQPNALNHSDCLAHVESKAMQTNTQHLYTQYTKQSDPPGAFLSTEAYHKPLFTHSPARPPTATTTHDPSSSPPTSTCHARSPHIIPSSTPARPSQQSITTRPQPPSPLILNTQKLRLPLAYRAGPHGPWIS